MDTNTFFKNMKHTEIECPVCKKHELYKNRIYYKHALFSACALKKLKECKTVYYDEWHDEYVCKKMWYSTI